MTAVTKKHADLWDKLDEAYFNLCRTAPTGPSEDGEPLSSTPDLTILTDARKDAR